MSLADLLSDLRAEAGLSQNVAHGVTLVEPHKALLRRIQEELWLAFDWPHLNTHVNLPMNPGQRYYAYPPGVAFEGIKGVSGREVGQMEWQALGYGISERQLNQVDSDSGRQRSPIRRWQNYISPAAENINSNMFEVWPIPSHAETLRFKVKRELFPLLADSDLSTIDGPLVVLHAAAEILARNKSEEAGLKLQKAAERRKAIGLRQAASDTRRVNMARTVRSGEE